MIKLPSRYEHRRLLGAGGMGQVHLVFDREREQDVALKTFAPAAGADAAEGRFLFKQEFWAMSSLSHPNLVAGYDYGELEDGTPYLTMEAVPGQDLADSRQSEAELRSWLPGVAAALGYLHGRGYVHGDLKPENIRLREDGVPKLMDLGLLTRSGRAGGAIRGSLHYLAPEAIRQGAVDARTDLYGLGAVMYHLLAGRPPFEGDQAIVLLRAHLENAPEPLRRHAPEVSRELEAVVMKLLAKDPGSRYAAAGEVLEALGLAADGIAEVGLLGSPLVGREAAQSRLAARQPGIVWLTGASGAGKTRLLTEARAEAQLAGVKTFYAQGQGSEAPPYEAVKPWLRALATPEHPAFDRLGPIVARVVGDLGVASAAPLEGVQERVRLHAAVAELATTSLEAAFWLIDDADALDAASRELVQFLQAQGANWSWAATGAAAPQGAEALALDPLDEAATLALARALLGQEALPAALAERLHVLSGGVPGAIEAVLGHWLRTGALRREAGSWVAGPESAFELPGGLSVALDSRFAALGEAAQEVGRNAAVLGAVGDLELLAELVGLPQGRFFAALAELEAASVLLREGQAFRFVRPAQAQALAASWEAQALAERHGVAARALASSLGHAPEAPEAPLGLVLAVAHHHLAGPTPELALPWVVAGVKRAVDLYALDGTEALLGRALAVEGPSADERLPVQVLLAQVLRILARVDEAIALFEGTLLAAVRERGGALLAQQLVSYGILLQMKSRYSEALAVYAEAINMADALGDAHTGVRARLFAGRVAYFAGESGAARTHLASAVRRAEEEGLDTLLAGALSFYGYVLATTDHDRASEGIALLERSIVLNREIGDLVELQDALNNQGNIYMHAGRLAEAERAFRDLLAICERMGSTNETIFALLNLGAVKLDLGALADAQSHARQAAELSQKQGRKFPEGFSVALEGLAMVYRGEIGAGVERLDRGVALAREIANKYLELNVLAFWIEAMVHLGRWQAASEGLIKARALAEATQNDELNPKFDRHEATMQVVLRYAAAPERLAALVEAAREKHQDVPLAHALRLQAQWLAGAGDGETALVLLDEAMALAAASGLAMLQAELALAKGRVLVASEQLMPAAEQVITSLGHARACGYVLGEIEAQAAMGAVVPGERASRREAMARLSALLSTLEAPEREAFLTWPERAELVVAPEPTGDGVSLDRLHHLTELMAAVSAQPDLEAVMAQALAALVEIAGAERGFLLLYSGFEVTQQIFHGMREDESDDYSTSLAYQVLWSGEPVFIEDASTHAELGLKQSIQALELRSVVGVPLFDGEEVLGVMMADSQRINTRFGAADLELAMMLARQVAITITNTRRLARYRNGYEELAVLHRLALATLGAPDLEAFLAPVAVEAAALAGAERAFLLLGDELACAAAFDKDGRALGGEARDLSHSVSRWVYDTGEPLHLFDAQSDDTFQAQKSVMALGLRTVFAVPAAYGGTRHGVLYLDNQRVVASDAAVLHTLGRIGEMVGAYLSRTAR